jgi:phytanoyl-CoA hydroxylase
MVDAQTQILERYRQDGFVVARGLVSRNEVDTVLKDAQAVFRRQFAVHGIPLPEPATPPLYLDAMERLFQSDMQAFVNAGKQCQHLISLHRLAVDERILCFVRSLGLSDPNISTRPVLYFNHQRLAKKEVYWRVFAHQDWRSMQGSLDAVVAWLPLARITSDLGPLELARGSHLEGLLTDRVEDGFGRVGQHDLVGRQFESLDTEVGDVVFFSAFLVHQSGTNLSDAIRWSCHFRYNNLAEPHFIRRGFPHPYVYRPDDTLLTPDFPLPADVRRAFARPE